MKVKKKNMRARRKKMMMKIKKNGKKGRGRKQLKEPEDKVPDNAQINFTDRESRIMKYGNSDNFEQSYNMQATVETETMLIVGAYPTQKANDKEEIKKGVESRPSELKRKRVLNICADTGYFSGKLIEETEKENKGIKIFCAVKRERHGKTVNQILEKLPENLPKENPEDKLSDEVNKFKL